MTYLDFTRNLLSCQSTNHFICFHLTNWSVRKFMEHSIPWSTSVMTLRKQVQTTIEGLAVSICARWADWKKANSVLLSLPGWVFQVHPLCTTVTTRVDVSSKLPLYYFYYRGDYFKCTHIVLDLLAGLAFEPFLFVTAVYLKYFLLMYNFVYSVLLFIIVLIVIVQCLLLQYWKPLLIRTCK